MANSSCHLEVTLPWETTATTVWTAVIGGSFRAQTLWVVRSLFTGLSLCLRPESMKLPSRSEQEQPFMNLFISSMRLAGAGRSTEFSEQIQTRNELRIFSPADRILQDRRRSPGRRTY